jgi:hypothetical protein
LLLCLAASAAERPSGERREPASSGAVKTSPSETSARAKVPKDAVEVEPGTWRWTDQEGRKWLFRQTPFGIAKLEEGRKPRSSANDARLDAQLIESMKAVEKGDEIAFERPGPFGTYRWKRKKSELDEQEKAAWDRSRTKSPDSVKGRE